MQGLDFVTHVNQPSWSCVYMRIHGIDQFAHGVVNHLSVDAWCCVWRVDQRHVFSAVLQARQAPTTAMVDFRCPVRLQTQVTGEEAGIDSVGDDFIKEAEIWFASSDLRFWFVSQLSDMYQISGMFDVEVIDASSVRACAREKDDWQWHLMWHSMFCWFQSLV